ncbi:MAG: (2Fe-2S)-binding protein [Candidatus Wallbacteria bacterium]|nr:(2Fe-2S)-binding protein [Candidatus Wallbacteria bacterium]
MKIEFVVNGKTVFYETSGVEMLGDFLRNELNLNGVKEGCGKGECGACTVLVDNQPVASCITPLSWIDGKNVLTIEGLEQNGELHPIQQAFLEEGAVQCGFCTPGMVLTAYALLLSNPAPTRDEIARALAGNLCRCTGYDKIFKAVEKVIGRMNCT